MYVYIYIYTHIYIYIYIHTHTCVYIYIYEIYSMMYYIKIMGAHWTGNRTGNLRASRSAELVIVRYTVMTYTIM